MFSVMLPSAGWSRGTPGNKRANKGASARAASATRPARSPIFIKPSHSAITPVRPSEISKPLLAASNSALTMAAKMSVCPSHTACASAAARASRINADQMTLSTMLNISCG